MTEDILYCPVCNLRSFTHMERQNMSLKDMVCRFQDPGD